MIINYHEGYLLKLRERQMIVEKRITSGGCKNQEEYRHQIGRLQGLMDAEEVAKQHYKAMFETTKLQGGKDDVRKEEFQFY